MRHYLSVFACATLLQLSCASLAYRVSVDTYTAPDFSQLPAEAVIHVYVDPEADLKTRDAKSKLEFLLTQKGFVLGSLYLGG